VIKKEDLFVANADDWCGKKIIVKFVKVVEINKWKI